MHFHGFRAIDRVLTWKRGATLVVGVMVKILQHNQLIPPSSAAKLCLPVALVLNYAALDFNFTSWMSPDNLRVLRSEQSTGNLPGLRELASQKDHLQHVSPLSMVGGKRGSGSFGKRRGLRRGKSWKDALMDLAGNATSPMSATGANEEMEDALLLKASAEKDRLATATAMKRKSSVKSFEVRTHGSYDEGGFWADEESDGSDVVREEDRPLEERVRYVYRECPSPAKETTKSPLPPSPHQHLHACLESQQKELSEAVQKANIKAVTLVTGGDRPERQGKGKEREPIGTRLTMTSRTGYFQDRIVSPSMVSIIRFLLSGANFSTNNLQMRAMAILYIGPHRNPDFATDYLLSPILTPSSLLAQFPPVLMQCGEKDPFVDDTVIFAGRVREAKRARKTELDEMLSCGGSASSKFGEDLRMSHVQPGDFHEEMLAERERLARESEDDWVQMVLFKDWSHGYLQMMALMKEARAVVDDLSDWIEDAFVRYGGRTSREEAQGLVNGTTLVHGATTEGAGPAKKKAEEQPRTRSQSHLPTTATGIPSPSEMARSVSSGPNRSSSTSCPSPFASEGETDDSGITFVARKWLGTSSAGCSGRGSRRGSERSRTPMSEPGEVGTPRGGNGGQRISEGELMRRRRLLDAHIFDAGID